MSNYNVFLNCVVFSTNASLNQRLLFSLKDSEIILPSLELTPEILPEIEKSLITFLKQYIFVNDLDLMPQLININSDILSKGTHSLNVIYGFIVPYTKSINQGHWVEFQLLQEQKYSPLLFEVMQKLR